MDLGTTLRQSAAQNPRKSALVCGDQAISYESLNRSTDALARWLLGQGLEPGDRVAIHWQNAVDTVNLYFACFKAGLIAVPVNNRLKAPEIAYILGHSGAKLCFSQPELAPFAVEARADSPDLQRLYTSLPPLAEMPAARAALPDISPEKVASVLYTSGTTARPKGVMHTHVSLTGVTELMRVLGIDETHVLLAATQLVHIAALACVLLPGIACGATVVLLPLFDAPSCLDAIALWRCTYLLILPAMLRFVVEEQARCPRNVGSVRLCLAGGDTVPVTLQESFRAQFGVAVREMFGMTETAPVTCIREDEPRSDRSAALWTWWIPAWRILPATSWATTNPASSSAKPGNCVGYWDDPQPPPAHFRTAGCVRATWCGGTPTGSIGLKGASSRSSFVVVPISRRRRWRRRSTIIRRFWKPGLSECRTRSMARK